MGLEISLHGSNLGQPMFALGQKQTLGKVRLMSALPPKADIGGWDRLALRDKSDSAVAGRPAQHGGDIGGRITSPSDDLVGADQWQIGLIDVAGLTRIGRRDPSSFRRLRIKLRTTNPRSIG